MIGAIGTRQAERDGSRKCGAVFPTGRRIEASPETGVSRHVVIDPRSDCRWVLGAAELRLAQLFDGERTYEEIRRAAAAELGGAPSVDRVTEFERRLLAIGLLESTASRGSIARDPFTGRSYGWIHDLLVVRIVSFDPDALLDRLLARRPWLSSRLLPGVGLLFVLLATWILAEQGRDLLAVVPAVISGPGWLWLYVSVALSSIAHEGGHALACRSFGVRVREVGLVSYFLVPMAWTRADQDTWTELPLRRRVATILAGPFGSLVWGASGVLLWWMSRWGVGTRDLGVVLAVSALFGIVPTLLPATNGDGYLLLTQVFGLPELRTRSFQHLRACLRRDTVRRDRVTPRLGAVYLAYACTTVVSWIAIWIALVLACVCIVRSEFRQA